MIAIVLRNAQLTELGAIVQVSPGGGGCIAAMQVQAITPNNTPGQTLLYLPMRFHPENGPQ